MSLQINCHLPLDEKPVSAYVIFAEIIAGKPSVCFEIEGINIYFKTSKQIRQVIGVLMEAEDKMDALEASQINPVAEPAKTGCSVCGDNSEECIRVGAECPEAAA